MVTLTASGSSTRANPKSSTLTISRPSSAVARMMLLRCESCDGWHPSRSNPLLTPTIASPKSLVSWPMAVGLLSRGFITKQDTWGSTAARRCRHPRALRRPMIDAVTRAPLWFRRCRVGILGVCWGSAGQNRFSNSAHPAVPPFTAFHSTASAGSRLGDRGQSERLRYLETPGITCHGGISAHRPTQERSRSTLVKGTKSTARCRVLGSSAGSW